MEANGCQRLGYGAYLQKQCAVLGDALRIPHEAIEAGVSIIYRERKIPLKHSVAENIRAGFDDCETETSFDVRPVAHAR